MTQFNVIRKRTEIKIQFKLLFGFGLQNILRKSMKLALLKYNGDFSVQSDPKSMSMSRLWIELEVNIKN